MCVLFEINVAPAVKLGAVLLCSAKSRRLSTSTTRPVGTHWGINNAPLRSVMKVELKTCTTGKTEQAKKHLPRTDQMALKTEIMGWKSALSKCSIKLAPDRKIIWEFYI